MTQQAEKKGGLGRIITGIVLMAVIAPALGIGLLIWGLSGAEEHLRGAQTVRSGETVHLEAGQKKYLWTSEADSDGAPRTECRATGPGNPSITTPGSSANFTVGGKNLGRTFQLTATESGDHVLSCTHLSQVYVTDAAASDAAIRNFVIGLVGGILGAILVFLVGVVLLVLGIVRRVRTRRPAAPAHPAFPGQPIQYR